MCKKHWYMVPAPIRAKIWATYRHGQCDDWKISEKYAEAAEAAIRAVAKLEGRPEPDVSMYDILKPGNPAGDLVRGIREGLRGK